MSPRFSLIQPLSPSQAMSRDVWLEREA